MLEPYGLLTSPLVHSQRLVASTAQFQAWCRESIVGFPDESDAEASYEAALARVRIGAWDTDVPLSITPVCLVAPLPEALYANMGVGPTTGERGTVLLKFERNIPEDYLGANNYGDALLDFGGCTEDGVDRGLGLILEQMDALSEEGGTIQIRGFQLLDGPGFNNKDEVTENKRQVWRCYCDVLLMWGQTGFSVGDT
jgi:hypothetical protein